MGRDGEGDRVTPSQAAPRHDRPTAPSLASVETREALGLYLEGAAKLARVRLLEERLPAQAEAARAVIRAAVERLGSDPLELGPIIDRGPGVEGRGTYVQGSVRRRIIAALREGPARPAEIVTRSGLTRAQVDGNLAHAVRAGLVVREGEPGSSVYRLPDGPA